MRPKPTMPIVKPASSIGGAFQKQKSGLAVHSPACTAALCSPTRWQSSRSSAKTCWATESVPYSGTFDTGMPRCRAAPTSTML